MAPIFDSDVSERRWDEDQWRNYELWERIERRLRRYRRFWIIATIILFAILSSIPVFIERWPKWFTLQLARKTAVIVSELKTNAALTKRSYRMRFTDGSRLKYTIESAIRCDSDDWKTERTGHLVLPSGYGQFQLLSGPTKIEEETLNLRNQFCFDPFLGRTVQGDRSGAFALAFVSVNDAIGRRMDRMSFVYLRGPNLEVSFD